jgi:hypothetical protein
MRERERGGTRSVREASAAAAGPWVCGAGGERQSAMALRSGSGGLRAEAVDMEPAAETDRGGRCGGTSAPAGPGAAAGVGAAGA